MKAVSTLPPLPSRTLHRSDAAALLAALESQQLRKLDIVVPGTSIRSRGGRLAVDGLESILTPDGFFDVNGRYEFTNTAIGHVIADYNIPGAYLRRCRADNPRAFDNTINDWARYDNKRNVLMRLLWGSDRTNPGSSGIARAILSDSYGFRDNLDMATAFLEGLHAAGVDDSRIMQADLSDDNLYMRVSVPQIAVMAPELLAGYRSPFTGESGVDCPTVFAGVVFRNSETGQGKTSVSPEIRIKVCNNGLTITKHAVAQIHRGTRLVPGAVHWKRDTYKADDHAFTLKIRDTVASFLTREFLQAQVDEISGAAQVKLRQPETTVTVVSQSLGFTKEERSGIWGHFLQSGAQTAGGVMHAITSWSQVIAQRGGVDRANELDAVALKALHLAAAHA